MGYEQMGYKTMVGRESKCTEDSKNIPKFVATFFLNP